MAGKPTYEELEQRLKDLQEEAMNREEAEEALREREERYRNFVVNASEGIYCIDFTAPIPVDVSNEELSASISRHAVVREVNDALVRMYGLEVQDMIGRPATDFAPGYGERAVLAVRTPRNQVRDVETLDVDKEGNTLYLSESYTAVIEEGILVRIWGMQQDITDRKKAEQALEENRNFIDKIINTAPNLVYIYDLVENRNAYSNKGIHRLLGFSGKEIQAMGEQVFPTLIHPDDLLKVTQHHEIVKKSEDGETFEIDYRVRNCQGEYRILRSWDTVFRRGHDGIAQQIIGLAVDVTEQIRAEELLKFEKERTQQYLDVAGVILIALDKTGKVTLINPKGCKILGYPQEEIIGKDWFDTFLFSKNIEEVKAVFGQIIAGDVEPVRYFENPIRTRDGKNRLVAWHNSILKNAQGNIIGLFSSGEDITDRKQAEEALQKSEERYRQLADLLPQVIFETDEQGHVIFANRMAFELFGFTKADFEKGFNAFQALIPEDREKAAANMQRTFRGEALGGTEYTALNKDGRTFPVIIYSSPILSDGKPVGLRGTVVDLTEIKQAQKILLESEEKLARSRKMEAMGLMAGGVAHDLNNILSGIVSYPELLLMDLPEDSPLRKPIMTMQESGMKAANVVADLLSIARGVATGKEVLNLNTIVSDYLESPEYQALGKTHATVSFKTDLDSELLNMNGSPTHVKKTLMNLVTNASEAIEGYGTVTISTSNRYLDEPLKGYEDVRVGEYAVLVVRDNGSGISSQDLERIFEPFYTKKMMGRSGTGLGLAVVWNTVQDHDGYIDVQSTDEGTVFELYFPVTREEEASEKERVPLQDYHGHGERILVVDDEERQREIACGMLKRLGYFAEAVSSGEEAIEYVKEHRVDLIVLDMVMPQGINGRETYGEIIKIRPGQKAIIASGYAKTKEVELAQLAGAGKYIKKPYTLERVGLAVMGELKK